MRKGWGWVLENEKGLGMGAGKRETVGEEV